jgi:ribonuclease III
MKAKIIETGEIVTILAISTEHMTIQCYGNDGIVRLEPLSRGDIEIVSDTEKNIDWEQRRYELAKDAMNSILTAPIIDGVNPNPSAEDIAMYSVKLADALIKELKGG